RRGLDLLRRQRALLADLVPGQRLHADERGHARPAAPDRGGPDRLPHRHHQPLPGSRDAARPRPIQPVASRRGLPLPSGRRPAVRRLAAIGAVLAAVAVALVTLGVSGTSGNYRVDALFDNADYLIS